MHKKELKFEWKGVTFTIRGTATRGDQYEMHAAMADATKVLDGRVIETKAAKLYPWLVERFVTGWSLEEPFSMKALLEQPADPGEDLIIALGSHILLHTGMVPTQEQVALKND